MTGFNGAFLCSKKASREGAPTLESSVSRAVRTVPVVGKHATGLD